MVVVGFKPDLWRPTGFLQCFDTVGLVIWPVKIIPEMTYYVSSGTINLYTLIHSLNPLLPGVALWGQTVGVHNIFPSALCGCQWYVPHDNLSPYISMWALAMPAKEDHRLVCIIIANKIYTTILCTGEWWIFMTLQRLANCWWMTSDQSLMLATVISCTRSDFVLSSHGSVWRWTLMISLTL